jgi:transcription antitermination factor NusG
MAVACPQTTDHPWFALAVKPLREKYVGCVLAGKGFDVFVPLYRDRRRWSDRVKEVELPLFPGYIFCRLDLNNRLPVLVTPFVHSIVGMGKTPIPVTDSEVEAIRTIVTSGQDTLPWNYLPAGCTARIEEGPLKGLEGVLIEVKKQHRLVVSVTLLQRSVAVEVDRSWLTPVRPPIRVHPCSSVAL